VCHGAFVLIKIRFLAFFLLSLAMVPSAAFSKMPACTHKGTIISLADRLLDDLTSVDPYIASYSATDALYLKMQYGRMGGAEIEAMFSRLPDVGIYGIKDFIFSYLISEYGYENASARFGRENLRYFESHPYDLTLMHQLTTIGRYDLVIENLKRVDWPNDRRYKYPPALPMIEFSVAERRSFAEKAERAGQTLLAGSLYASLPTHEAWPGFLKRNVEKEGFRDQRENYITFSAYNANSPLLPDPRNNANWHMYLKFFQIISTAVWHEPEASLLGAFEGRYKFEILYSKRAAQVMLAAKQDELRPDGPMDKGWLFTFRALAKTSGDPEMIVQRMQRVSVVSRHYLQASAGDILDTMLASEAIGPWMRGKSQAFPAIPPLASSKLRASWPEWQAMAETLQAGGDPDNLDRNFTRRGMAADLLYAKGDEPRLLALIAAENNAGFRQRLTVDFMARYDRLCDSKLYFPGAAVFLRRGTIHRFDTQK
jgi:hypothetical protein